MNRRMIILATAALLVGGVAATSTASASSNFAVSIGLPGFGVGYSSNGVGFVAAAPGPFAAPYYAPPVVTYVRPVAVLPAPWYRPYARYYRAPVRIGYYHNHW
jgi:hypothetical protein